MQTQFVRESMNYFFVVKRQDEWNDSYEKKLFRVCDVPYFMPYEMREVNGVAALYYKMSFRTTLRQALECVNFTADKIDSMIRSIIGVLESCEEYLVIPDNIMFDAEYVFFDIDTGELRFCYDFEKQEGKTIKDLVMELLQHVDKRCENGVVHLLKFYNTLTEPDCTVEKLKNFNNKVDDISVCSVDNIKDDQVEVREEEPQRTKCHKKGTGIRINIVRILKLIILLTAVTDIALLIGLICNVLTYEKTGYLFIGMALLIGLVIVYMNFDPEEESADEIMEEYRKTREFMDYNRDSVDNNMDNETSDEATILLYDEEEMYELGTVEKSRDRLVLEAMDKEMYNPIHINSKSVVIGSMRNGCDYVLSARGISRLHAKLFDKSDGIYIMDMNSTNGTYINGVMLQAGKEYKLEEGDLISFAGVQYYALQER